MAKESVKIPKFHSFSCCLWGGGSRDLSPLESANEIWWWGCWMGPSSFLVRSQSCQLLERDPLHYSVITQANSGGKQHMQVAVCVLPCPACSAFIYLWTSGYIHGISAAFPEGLFVHLNFSKSGDRGGERLQI